MRIRFLLACSKSLYWTIIRMPTQCPSKPAFQPLALRLLELPWYLLSPQGRTGSTLLHLSQELEFQPSSMNEALHIMRSKDTYASSYARSSSRRELHIRE